MKIKFLKIFFQNIKISIIILIIGLILTGITSYRINKDDKIQSNNDFNLVCNDLKLKIINRLEYHSMILQSGSAFFTADDTVTRLEWNTFINRTKFIDKLKGIQGIGYSIIIPKEELQNHIKNTKKEGFPNYKVFPEGDRDIYTSIIFLEPFSDRNLRAFGYDMYSEKIRRKAMELARDSDMAIISGKVILVQETSKDIQSGTLMYVPVYNNNLPRNTVEERRKSIRGWVYSPYRMNDLMINILGRWDENLNRIHLQIYDESISDSSLLFDSQIINEIKHENYQKEVIIPINFNGKNWILHFDQLERKLLYKNEIIIIICGILISILLSMLYLSLFNTQKKAEKIAEKLTSELKESEQKFRLLHQHSGAGVGYYKLDGTVISYNKLAAKHMGGVPEDFIGKSIYDIFSKEEAEFYIERLKKCANSNTSDVYEDEIKLPSDNMYFLSTFSKVVDTDDNIIGIQIISQDITKTKQHEQTLIKLSNDKDKFISILAHDLKSPFNALLGLSSLLSENVYKYNTEKIQDISNNINKSAQTTFNLLEDLLMWARSQTGKLDYNPQDIAFLNICQEVLSDLELISDSKNITIDILLSENIIFHADVDMLKTILRNLISNAIKFTKVGGKINIYTQRDNKYLTIIISDNGLGIPKEKMDIIFDSTKMYTTKGTSNENGTGLGLPLCKEFVEKHGGKIWVESEVGVGSEFKFTLPLN